LGGISNVIDITRYRSERLFARRLIDLIVLELKQDEHLPLDSDSARCVVEFVFEKLVTKFEMADGV